MPRNNPYRSSALTRLRRHVKRYCLSDHWNDTSNEYSYQYYRRPVCRHCYRQRKRQAGPREFVQTLGVVVTLGATIACLVLSSH